MYNKEVLDSLIKFIQAENGINKKDELTHLVKDKYNLKKGRSVYYGPDFAIRFCKARSPVFSNTVLSLSTLRKYDDKPFVVCTVTPAKNYLLLANTTFLSKISHSSMKLRVDNIRGSFNGSDIIRSVHGLSNEPKNFEALFAMHESFTFEENLARLVDSTNNICPTGSKFTPSDKEKRNILDAPERARRFLESEEYKELNRDLAKRVKEVESEIAIAAFIDNVNVRGRVIQCLITSKDGDEQRNKLIEALLEKKPLPPIKTDNDLGDYSKVFGTYITETDIKSKVLSLSSNPKGYNIDKVLEFLAQDKTVYMICIVAIDENKKINTKLCSMFNAQLLSATTAIPHWAGRNSKGVTQYNGYMLEEIVNAFDKTIDINSSKQFLKHLLEL